MTMFLIEMAALIFSLPFIYILGILGALMGAGLFIEKTNSILLGIIFAFWGGFFGAIIGASPFILVTTIIFKYYMN